MSICKLYYLLTNTRTSPPQLASWRKGKLRKNGIRKGNFYPDSLQKGNVL